MKTDPENFIPDKTEQQTQAEPDSPVRGTVENKAAKPAGLLPKNTQQLVILGVAVTMVLIIWLTGGAKRAVKTATAATSAAGAHGLDPTAVQDFKQTIQKEQAATRQPISPTDMARLQALGLAGDVPPGGQLVPPETGAPTAGGVIGGVGSEQSSQPDPVKEDKKKRQYLSLFAPNVAFTYRRGLDSEQGVGQRGSAGGGNPSSLPSTAAQDLDGQLRSAQSQLEQPNRMADQTSPPSQGVAPAPGPPARQVLEGNNPNDTVPATFNSFAGKRYVAFEGTIIETLLINRLNGTFSGPVN
ncbi:MAG: hypothetical protein WBQ89_09025, partial [Candidatus Acidiferrum sp.]